MEHECLSVKHKLIMPKTVLCWFKEKKKKCSLEEGGYFPYSDFFFLYQTNIHFWVLIVIYLFGIQRSWPEWVKGRHLTEPPTYNNLNNSKKFLEITCILINIGFVLGHFLNNIVDCLFSIPYCICFITSIRM